MTVSEKICSALRSGENNAVSLAEMCSISGLDNRRTRLVIEDLRRSGMVIISSNKGYYLPENLEEIRHYINKESKRARSIFYTLRTAKALERKLLAECSQISFSESEDVE